MFTLSALVITFNEEANIYRTLDSIRWIDDVLVLDSGSTDRTVDIVNKFPNTRIIYRKFDSFANQCNFGLSCLDSEWVLSLDSDYVLSPDLTEEIRYLIFRGGFQKANHRAYSIRFQYWINGKPIRSGILPARTCLYLKEYAKYRDEGHGHKVSILGSSGQLKNKIFHDDRKPLSVWIMTQKKYQALEAMMLRGTDSSSLPIQDIIRKHTFLAPFAALFMCLFIRGGILDGKEGLIYALQRFVAESLLYLFMNLESNAEGCKDGQLRIHHLG
jgi:glycosyltransferase involved in cell wall biosynthesis